MVAPSSAARLGPWRWVNFSRHGECGNAFTHGLNTTDALCLTPTQRVTSLGRSFANAVPAREGDSVTHDDRETPDAASPRRRTRLLLPLLVLVLVNIVVGIVIGGPCQGPPPVSPTPPAVVAVPPPVEVPVDVATRVPVEVVPPPTRPTPVKAPARPRASSSSSSPSSSAGPTIILAAAVGGDVAIRRQVERALQGRLGSLVAASPSQASYSVMVNVDQSSSSRDQATVACSASIAVMPRRTITASLKSRADVAGEGTPLDELFDDAAAECAKSLAADVKAWLKAHPHP